MIVRRVGAGVELITQPDHAQLARTIMDYCVPLRARPRRGAILHAIAEHDNGWAEEDAAPTVDPATGNVADFITVPLSVRHAVWPRGIARLADDPWAAALVAQHALTVYDRFRGDSAWRSGVRSRRIHPAWIVAADYPFLRLGDLISLAFCTGSTDVQTFGGWTVQLSGARVAVTPDPFGGATIPVAISARTIHPHSFGSDAELHDTLRHASSTILRGEVAGS